MIVSRGNQRIKDIRRLRRSKGDRALLEGPHLVAEALAAGIEIEFALATPSFLQRSSGAELASALDHADIEWQRVEASVLESVSDSDSPRGILAAATLPRAGIETLPARAGGLYVFAEGLQEPGNLGALARVAEATGVAGLGLGHGSAHPNHPRALRASAGSLLRLPTGREATVDGLRQLLGSFEPTLLALVPRGGQAISTTPPLGGAIVLLLGSEGSGLGDDSRERADLELSLPMEPPVESLNATVAAAVALYEIQRRRSALDA